MRILEKLAVLSVTCLALAGCGGGGNGSESPVASSSPQCAAVWLVGKTIDKDYDGCLDDADTLVAAIKTNCTDGSELTTYDDRYWAVLGGEVKDAGTIGTAASSDYASDLAACEG